MEIANVQAHKIISDDVFFLFLKFDKITLIYYYKRKS